MGVKRTGRERMDQINLAQDREEWRALVDRNFLTD